MSGRWLAVLCAAHCACDGGGAPAPVDAATSDVRDAGALDGPRDAGFWPDAGPLDPLDEYLLGEMGAGAIPGLAVAILKGGGVAWSRSLGWADVEGRRVVDEHTLFVLASVSKAVLSVPLMQLVEAGVLDLDAAVDEYVAFPVRNPSYSTVPITARMIATHTSSIADDDFELLSVTTSGTDPTESLEDFAREYVTPGGEHWDDGNFSGSPGTHYDYSNAAFGILGHVMEAAADTPLRDLCEERLFAPLDMDGAGWFLADVDQSRLAVPYTWIRSVGFVANPQFGFAFYPAASLRVSLRGMSRFLLALINGGELDGVRLLEEDTVARMWSQQVPTINVTQAMVWRHMRVNDRAYVGHGGSTYGASTQVFFNPTSGIGVVVLTNSDAYVRALYGDDTGSAALSRIYQRLEDAAQAL